MVVLRSGGVRLVLQRLNRKDIVSRDVVASHRLAGANDLDATLVVMKTGQRPRQTSQGPFLPG